MPSRTSRARIPELGAVAVTIAAIVGFVWPVFNNGYVYDDVDVIERGEVIHDSSRAWELFSHHTLHVAKGEHDKQAKVDTYRPITLLSFMWDSKLSGREPWAYHATNLVMHLACVALLFLFLLRLFPSTSLGPIWFATTLFGLSPHPSTAHVWINGRSDLFCTFFGLASLLVWRWALAEDRHRRLRAVGLAVSAMLFLSGLLSKEVLLFALPMVVLFPEPQATPWPARLKRAAGFIVASGLYLALRVKVLDGLRSHESTQHLWTALSRLALLEVDGLLGALYPRRLYLRFMSEEFARAGPTALGLLSLLVIAVALVLWRYRRRAPLVAWGFGWFAVTLSPVAIIASMLWPGYGRYLYLPSVGLAVVVVVASSTLMARFSRLRPLWIVASVAYLLLLGVSLRGWVEVFHDEETLYTTTLVRHPEGAHAAGWLGQSRRQRGRNEDAIGPLALAHKRAPSVSRYAVQLFYGLVILGRYEEALQLAEEAAPKLSESADVLHMALLNGHRDDAPEFAAFNVLECLRKNPGSRQCGDAVTHLLTRHPRRDAFVPIVRQHLERPEFEALKRQMKPLLDSLTQK